MSDTLKDWFLVEKTPEFTITKLPNDNDIFCDAAFCSQGVAFQLTWSDGLAEQYCPTHIENFKGE